MLDAVAKWCQLNKITLIIILGPLLFMLYVNDLCHVKHVFNIVLKMYADDTVIYARGSSVMEVQKALQSCLDYVYKWWLGNRLYMNMKRTQMMWIGNNTNKNDVNINYLISIDGTSLSRIYSYQYLGMELDDTLSYDKHLSNVVNKTTQKLYIFRKKLLGDLLVNPVLSLYIYK